MCTICARLGLIVSGWLLIYPQILQLLGQGCLHAASVRVSRTPGWSWEVEDKVCVCANWAFTPQRPPQLPFSRSQYTVMF